MDQFVSEKMNFEDDGVNEADRRPKFQFVVDVDGFEGPLDLLLNLARSQKVDITRISILALAEQYLQFIRTARRLQLELAADYLVMAAWLAYLKSRLLIPEQEDENEPSAQELADELAFKLNRLEAMRDAAKKLESRNQLGREVLMRGDPEPVELNKSHKWVTSLYDLLISYAGQRQRNSVRVFHVERRRVWSLKEARDILSKLLGRSVDWVPIESMLKEYLYSPDERSTVIASTFSASLEMVKEGIVELRQSRAFDTLLIKAK